MSNDIIFTKIETVDKEEDFTAIVEDIKAVKELYESFNEIVLDYDEPLNLFEQTVNVIDQDAKESLNAIVVADVVQSETNRTKSYIGATIGCVIGSLVGFHYGVVILLCSSGFGTSVGAIIGYSS